MPLATEAQSLHPPAKVTLFQLDLTPLGGQILYWTNSPILAGSPPVAQAVQFGGNSYVPVEMTWEGYAVSSRGSLPRPRIRIGNTLNGVTQLLLQYKNLKGATLTRIQTFATHLDSGSEPDVLQIYAPDVYKVARKTSHKRSAVELELRAAIDVEGIGIPKEQLVRNCQAVYRRYDPATGTFSYEPSNAACPYTGDQAFDLNDMPTTPANDRASKTLGCCRARFGQNGILPFHGAPAAGRVQ